MSLLRALFTAAVLGCAAAVAHAGGPIGPAVATPPPPPAMGDRAAGVEASPHSAIAPRVTLLPSPDLPYVDRVVVRKSQRRLYLMDGAKVVRSYKIALGLEPKGPKQRDGDFRTPEGWYRLARRNPRSEFFLSIQISYPNAGDLQRAQVHHWQPGGAIMIHGLPNRLKNSPWYYQHNDWTDGCIAVSDADMVEIWLLTHEGTPIDILP
ncbi:MAG TPA: L,D-transpeptidase family protein [Steroidobacteraceae bacterium]|nr:L,D-transpeptidase family protein [Steroidobacteraceae bacterium]